MSYPILTSEEWEKIPPEYVWFAVDKIGKKYAYINKPDKSFSTWTPRGQCLLLNIDYNGCSDWQNSLQKRPTINEQPETTPTPAVTHVRLSMPDFERIATDFGLNVRDRRNYKDAAMYNPAGNISIIFVAYVPARLTVHDVAVTVHDQI